MLQVLDDTSVDLVTEILHCASMGLKDHRSLVVRKLALGLGVDPHQLEVVPHLVQEVVIVPLVMSRDWDGVGDPADDVQLLDADLVDLVEDVDAGDVGSVALDNINQFVRSSITAEGDVSVGDPVF